MKRIIIISLITLFSVSPVFSRQTTGESSDQDIPMSGDIPLPGETSTGPSPASYPVKISGYIENTLNAEYIKENKDEILLNNTRARVNLSGNPDKNLDFAFGMVGTMYTGNTTVDTSLYLPDDMALNPGTSELYAYKYKNDLFIQEAFATLYFNRLWIRAGRQKYYTGTGYAFNPTDLFNRKNPFDPSYEIDGIDALLVTLELPLNMRIQGLMRADENLDKSGYLARIKAHAGNWDFGLQYTRITKELVDYIALDRTGIAEVMAGTFDMDNYTREFTWDFAGGEFSGELFGIKLYGEGGYVFIKSRGETGSLSQAAKDHMRVLAGFDYTFDCELYIMAEYLRLDNGRTSKDDITLNDRMSYYSGEILSVNRDTLFSGISYPITDLTDLSLYVISGLNDRSIIYNPWIIWNVFPGASVELSGYIPTGSEKSQISKSGSSGFARIKVNF